MDSADKEGNPLQEYRKGQEKKREEIRKAYEEVDHDFKKLSERYPNPKDRDFINKNARSIFAPQNPDEHIHAYWDRTDPLVREYDSQFRTPADRKRQMSGLESIANARSAAAGTAASASIGSKK